MAKPGQRIRHYLIVEEIGSGGMATVYLAINENLDKQVALKELKRDVLDDPEWVARFQDEAKFTAALDHPNIVRIYDQFALRGTPYIVMEYLRLGSAKALVRALTLEQIVMALVMILDGLEAVEPAGIVHRDLKPENLLRTDSGTLKITDFGIAKALSFVGPARTRAGYLPGSEHYIAPELARGRDPSPQSDLYSVGVIAYQFIRGAPPFARSRNPREVLIRKVEESALPLEVVDPTIDIGVAQWVNRLLARDPQRRFEDAATASAALRGHADRALGPGWEERGILPVDEDPPRRPKPTYDLKSDWVDIHEVRHMAGKANADDASRKLSLRQFALVSLWRSLPAPAIAAICAFVRGESWLYVVAGVALIALTLSRFFDAREAYRFRGVRRSEKRGTYSARVVNEP